MKKDVVSETMRLLNENNGKYYYDVHISEDEVTGMGYSVFVKSDIHFDEDLEAEDIINLAIEQGKLDPEEAEYCNYVEEVDEEQYRNAVGENLTENTTENTEVYNQRMPQSGEAGDNGDGDAGIHDNETPSDARGDLRRCQCGV